MITLQANSVIITKKTLYYLNNASPLFLVGFVCQLVINLHRVLFLVSLFEHPVGFS
ncbi:MAG: hypothetical protein K0R51_563 [Cytophagaceae bacterium]|jgi:hypothetical protein|nr:hypothetical protein [Cytophagaceae bacterium]